MAKVDGSISISLYCAKSMLPQLEAIKGNTQKILNRKNEEDIHDLRVATRRIRTVLDIFQDQLPAKKIKPWLKGMRDITKSYGSIRDLDVQIIALDKIYQQIDDLKIRRGLNRIRLRIKQNREKKQEKTQQLTSTILKSKITIEMLAWAEATLESGANIENQYSQDLFQLANERIQSRLDEFLFFEVFIFDPDRIKELHQMRISAKRLRYALEIFTELYAGKTDFALNISREVQEYLGKIHDADFWIDFLPRFAQKELSRIHDFYGYNSAFKQITPGIDFLLENRKKERETLYNAFINDWKNWKLKETWLSLRKAIFLSSMEIKQDKNNSHNPASESGNKTQSLDA
jgi:CHAD domain-containing protein